MPNRLGTQMQGHKNRESKNLLNINQSLISPAHLRKWYFGVFAEENARFVQNGMNGKGDYSLH